VFAIFFDTKRQRYIMLEYYKFGKMLFYVNFNM